jgi:hypothetical protein
MILADQRSDGLETNSVESHPRLMMKGNTTQGTTGR